MNVGKRLFSNTAYLSSREHVKTFRETVVCGERIVIGGLDVFGKKCLKRSAVFSEE